MAKTLPLAPNLYNATPKSQVLHEMKADSPKNSVKQRSQTTVEEISECEGHCLWDRLRADIDVKLRQPH